MRTSTFGHSSIGVLMIISSSNWVICKSLYASRFLMILYIGLLSSFLAIQQTPICIIFSTISSISLFSEFKSMIVLDFCNFRSLLEFDRLGLLLFHLFRLIGGFNSPPLLLIYSMLLNSESNSRSSSLSSEPESMWSANDFFISKRGCLKVYK